MSNNILFRSLSLLAATLIPGSLLAQSSLDESISVDGRYEAEILRVDRVASFPTHFLTSMPVKELIYDREMRSMNFAPSFSPMPTADFSPNNYRGYLDVALGSWLDSDLRAGFWALTPDRPWSLGIWLDHQSTSLWKPRKEGEISFPRRFAYDETIGFQTGHTMANGNRFEAGVDYNVQYFNYFTSPTRHTQTINDFRAHASLASSETASLRYAFDFMTEYFGYRAFNLPSLSDRELFPSNETSVHVGGWISQSIGEKGIAEGDTFDLGFDLDGVFPGHGRDYGQLALTPTYSFALAPFRLRLGMEVDLTLNAGEKGNRYSFFHIAPNCLVYLPASSMTYYLGIGGGSELSTLSNLSRLTPYQSPYNLSTAPVFSPVDISLGFNGGPSDGILRGLEGGLEFRYKAVDHLPLLGWYPMLLATGGELSSEMLLANARGMALHGLSIRGRLGWSLPGILKAEADLAYSPQGKSVGYFNGLDRPEWIGNIGVTVTPISPLGITLNAGWRGNRQFYSRFGGAEQTLDSLELPDWFSLSAEVSWAFSDKLSVGAGVYNITDRKKNLLLPGLPSDGISAAARLSLLF